MVQTNDISLLDPKFVRCVKEAYLILLNNKLIRDDIEWQSRKLDLEQRNKLIDDMEKNK